MALRVWLPLNGNFKNQGTSLFTSPSLPSGASWGDGKLGKGLVINNAGSSSGEISDLAGLQKFTICFWYKIPSGKTFTQWSDLVYNNASSVLRLEVSNTSGTSTNWFGFGMDAGGLSGQPVTLDTWYHEAITVNGTTLTRYVNGIQKGQKTAGSQATLGNTIKLGDAGMYCTLCDLRIYDECLSPKQIHEISKGLIAHYKLEGLGANPNFIAYSDPEGMMSSIWSYSNATTRELDNSVLFNNKPSLHLGDSRAGYYGLHNENSFNTLKPSTTYHATVYLYKKSADNIPSNKPLRVYFPEYKSDKTTVINYRHYISLTNDDPAGEWIKKEATFTTDANAAWWKCSLDFQNVAAEAECWIGTIKLEEGSSSTDWIPNSGDAIYSKLGFDNMILTDVSGNGYNLSSYNNMSIKCNSPRYQSSSYFNGTDNRLYKNNFYLPNEHSVSIWFNPSRINDTTQYLYSLSNGTGGSADQQSALYINTTGITIHAGGTSSTLNYTFNLNNWYLIVLTCDGTTQKAYINGNLLGSASVGSKTGTFLTFGARSNNTGGAGVAASYFYQGLLSDTRFYATALSATDIKQLYEVAGFVDNANNMYAYEFKEE